MLSAFIHRALGGRWAKPGIFLLALTPLTYLAYGLTMDALGANPGEALLRGTGLWTLRMLCLAMLVTPLREAMGWTALARLRRMLGLFVFFYAFLHLLAYFWIDQGADWAEIVQDIPKRPFILVGLLTFILLVPLALTSFDVAVRWLGAKRWRALHRAVYAVAILALLHFFWMRSGKRNFGEVAQYAVILGALLTWRIVRRIRAPMTRPGINR